MSRADLTDPATMAKWLEGLRESFDDLDGLVADMLRRPRKRMLGPALHRKHYRAARSQIRTALAYAEAANDGTPSPDGGAP